MIRSFRHKGLEQFYRTASKAGIQTQHARRLQEMLTVLDVAESAKDCNRPGWLLHSLTDDLEGHWSARVDPRWRLTFRFEGTDVILLDYQDYHR